MTDFNLQRLNMVESQVRPSDVTDRRIVRAMAAVPREQFVPERVKAVAYMDNAAPLSFDAAGRPTRSLLPPRTLAKLLQLADLGDNAVVLDCGCGTGYSTAVIARIARRVIGLEPDSALAEQARANLLAHGITNATITTAALDVGNPAESPFDAIVLNGSVQDLPSALLDQLKDGGRLVAIIASGPAGKAVVCLRSGKMFDRREAFDATAAALPGLHRAIQFAL
jgi:protein-L-isoaspartate(D-aspartate) O-methyltransferase